jgi:PKD repeat protein
MAVFKIASTDIGYDVGQLSSFPEGIDTKEDLYIAANNAVTTLKQSLTYGGKIIFVEDNTRFPPSGILRIGPPPGQRGSAELVYYQTKTAGCFKDLIRGFAGSRQNPWTMGAYVSHGVFAEHHNSVKDAVLQLENKVGLKENPDAASLNGILKKQESRFLSPQARFRAFPTSGTSPLQVTFQNFTNGPVVKYLWDFGDGTTSAEESPVHTYVEEGTYTVKLNVITSLGSQGVTTKYNYISANNDLKSPFFYFLVERKSENEVLFPPTGLEEYTIAQYKENRIVNGNVELKTLFDGVQLIHTTLSGIIYSKTANAKTITSISIDNPTEITCVSHGFSSGDTVVINGSDSTPSIDGEWQITVTGPDTFTIPEEVTVVGTDGRAAKRTLVESESDYTAIQKFRTEMDGSIVVSDLVNLELTDTRVVSGAFDQTTSQIYLLWFLAEESESFIKAFYAQKKSIADIADPSTDTDDAIYSTATSDANTGIKPTTLKFIDQTDGKIIKRYWVFDGTGKVIKKISDGTYEEIPVDMEAYLVDDPNEHTIDFIYDQPGDYSPSLMILFENQQLSRAFLTNSIRVS